MPQEIERKYLVRLQHWEPTTAGALYQQGYLSSVKERVVRARIAGKQSAKRFARPSAAFHRDRIK